MKRFLVFFGIITGILHLIIWSQALWVWSLNPSVAIHFSNIFVGEFLLLAFSALIAFLFAEGK